MNRKSYAIYEICDFYVSLNNVICKFSVIFLWKQLV